MLASTMLAYIFIFLLMGSIVIPGPIIERMQWPGSKGAMIKAAMHANPLIMTSRALGKFDSRLPEMDIMRTDYMYTLADPIVGYGFTYPDWRHVGFIYVGISSLLLALSCMRFRSSPHLR
jgi:hypothetical protein